METRPILPFPVIFAGVMPTRHLLRGDNAGAVRPDNAGNLLAVLVHRSFRGSPELGGILHRNALGNDDDQTDLSLNSLKHGGFGEGGRHENDRNVRTGFGNSLGNGTENLQLNIGAVLCLVGNGGASLAGITPPTMFVPAASIRAVCLVPSPPVMP